MAILFLLFIVWRIGDFVIASLTNILHLAKPDFSFYFHAYQNIPFVNQYLLSFANFDGAHYLTIAREGYHQYEQTFFPLYPVLIHFLNPLFNGSYILTGFVIANLSFFFGLYFFKKYLELLGKKPKTILWILIFLLCFPTSFFFGAMYTEGLFFLLITASLYFAQQKRFIVVAIVSILAALTRLMGIFLVVPILAVLLADNKQLILKQKSWKGKIKTVLHYSNTHKKLILISLSPLVGLFIYMGYLFATTGDFLYFYHAQAAFNNGRSAQHIILLPQVYYRYIKILLTAAHDRTYFVAVVEFVIFTMFFAVLLYDLWKLWKQKHSSTKINLIGLNLFSFINLLLPTATGTLSSTPRYLLLSLSFFICIAEIKNILAKILLIILFIIFHVILLSFFIQGYFVS